MALQALSSTVAGYAPLLALLPPQQSNLSRHRACPSRECLTANFRALLLSSRRIWWRKWEELAMTAILAKVIGFGGVAIIALGLWGLYVLLIGELRLREYILAFQTIAVGFVLIGLAQALRLLLVLVALQQGH